jgi:hypothetical protein
MGGRLDVGPRLPLLFRDEKLLRERMRKTGSASKYDYLEEQKMVLLHGSVPRLITISVSGGTGPPLQ